jgi:hypothetical protein
MELGPAVNVRPDNWPFTSVSPVVCRINAAEIAWSFDIETIRFIVYSNGMGAISRALPYLLSVSLFG